MKSISVSSVSVSIFACLLLTAPVVGAQVPEPSKELVIGGTGTALCAMQKLATAFKKTNGETQIKVLPSLGSGGGIKALLAGSLSVSVSTRPVNDAEIAKGAVGFEIGRTPFVFASHAKTSVDTLTMGQLAAIYAGTTKTWADGLQVRPILRPLADIDSDLVRNMTTELNQSVQIAHSRESKNIAITDTDAADELEKIPGSVGTSTLALVVCEERKIKVLSVNGIAPSNKNKVNLQYPHMKSIYLVTTKNASPLAQKFHEFISSPTGTAILSENGIVRAATIK